MKLLLGIILGLPVLAQTYTCSGCTDYGLIGTTGYGLQAGSRMVWTVGGLDNDVYRVDLTFVESVYNTLGQRPLNVTVNDVQVLTNFDVIKAAGFMTPVSRSVLVPVNDGKILITLTASTTGGVAHKAVVSLIAVSKLVTGASSSKVVRYVNVKLAQISDGTWAPGFALVGKLIIPTLQVTRNGLVQDDSDYSFDGSNNSVRFRGEFQPDDKVTLSIDSQQ